MIVLALLLLAAPVEWVSHEAGKSVPQQAVRVSETETLYVCRAQLTDGVHPGVTAGGPCLVAQKGKVESFDKYELAVGAGLTWRSGDWDRAIVAGHQGLKKIDLYVCRAAMMATSSQRVFEGGKAYRNGPHAGHCYVRHQDREVDLVEDYELLVTK